MNFKGISKLMQLLDQSKSLRRLAWGLLATVFLWVALGGTAKLIAALATLNN